MIKDIKKSILIFTTMLLLICPGNLFAGKKTVDLKFKAKVKKEAIVFRWAPSDLNLNYSYKLFKLENKKETLIGTYKKITLENIPKTFSPENVTLITSLLYPQSLYKSDTEKLEALSQKENQKGMAFFLAELKPDVAKALGAWAQDADIKPDKVYAYILRAYENGKKVGEQGVVAKTSRLSPLYPPDVTTRRYEWGCALRWTNYDYYTAFNIYRNIKETGDFQKINKSPVSVNYIKHDNGLVEAPPYFYSDTSIDKTQVVYYYKVTGIDSFGDESPLSSPSFAIRDSSLRPPPQMPVSTEIIEPYIKVSWETDSNSPIKGYNIYRSSLYKGNYEKINKTLVTTESFMDKNVKYGVNYFYCHTATDERGNESVMSLPELAVLRDRTPPSVPLQLNAVARKGAVALSWQAVMDTDLKGYELYRASAKDASDWAMLNKGTLPVTNYTDTMVAVFDKKPYYYKVLAKDHTANRSGFSDIIEIKLPDVTPPKVPAWKGALSKDNTIILEWRASSTKDIAGYKVYRGRGNKQTLIAELPKEALSYTDKSVKPGDKVWYFLTAFDGDKNESELSSALEVKNSDKKPVSLENIKFSYTVDGVLITINAKDANFQSMSIQRKKDKQKTFKKIISDHRSESFLDKYVDKNKKYTYKITAYDKSGNATLSPETEVVTK